MEEIRVQRQPWYAGFSVLIQDISNRKFLVAPPLKFIEGDCYKETVPTLIISDEKAQLLMDDLWQCGIRPTEKVGTVGQMKATQEHLSDMRKIAWKFLKLPPE